MSEINELVTITAELSAEETVQCDVIVPDIVSPPTYEGDYAVTPGAETLTLVTEGLRMRQNVTINPVPSNYGQITWNGSTLTVS